MSHDAPLGEHTDNEQAQPRWQPLSSVQRRVIGVLVEKAKTTPDSYPMTLNALTNGCNQKSNRAPQMDLSTDDVEQAIEELREMGAAAEVQAGGRVPKYRHYMYEWLGVDKVEMAVMTELMLRGEQTLGELRGRASRMEPIPDLGALRPVLESLLQKNLIVSLTPEGRGQVITHNLYSPERLEEIRAQYATGRPVAQRMAEPAPAPNTPPAVSAEEFEQLRSEVTELRSEIAQLRDQLDRLTGI